MRSTIFLHLLFIINNVPWKLSLIQTFVLFLSHFRWVLLLLFNYGEANIRKNFAGKCNDFQYKWIGSWWEKIRQWNDPYLERKFGRNDNRFATVELEYVILELEIDRMFSTLSFPFIDRTVYELIVPLRLNWQEPKNDLEINEPMSRVIDTQEVNGRIGGFM